MSLPPRTAGRDGAGVPALPEVLGTGGESDTIGRTGSMRSGAGSARSVSSAISMHANSYSYLSNRLYDFVQARSSWEQRKQHNEFEGHSDDGEDVLKRLPLDFEPFFPNLRACQPRSSRTNSSASTTSIVAGWESGSRVADFAFRICFAVFSSRHWDRIYLLLGLVWSVLCPGDMDGAIQVARPSLALLLLMMFAVAAVPMGFAAVLRVIFSSRLRSCLLHSNTKDFAGVFFIFTTKAASVPALCRHRGRVCHRQVADNEEDGSGDEGDRDGRSPASKLEEGIGEKKKGRGKGNSEEDEQRAPLGEGGGGWAGSSRATTPRREQGGDRPDGDGSMASSPNARKVDLPPRHWQCILCKKVNMLPDEWDGRAGKVVQVVIKRKVVDTQAMYGEFKTKPGVPLCRKCQTPFNYSFRNGRDQPSQQKQRRDMEAALSRPTTAGSAGAGSARDTEPTAAARITNAGDDEREITDGGVSISLRLRVVKKIEGFIDGFWKVVAFIHGIFSPSRRRRNRNEMIDRGGAVRIKSCTSEPELWYGREFRRQVATYFKPELNRPVLSSPFDRGKRRYQVGARVACFAGKEVWYPGTVVASRENDTFDVRYDNGDIAQHVFPHMIRSEPTRRESCLLCCYYGLALVAAAAWPLSGYLYFSSVGTAATAENTATAATAAALVAAPALIVGAAGVLVVGVEFWGIYADNTSTGLFEAAKFGAIFALPSLSLAIAGLLAIAKAMNPGSAGSWVKMLLLPSIFFSLTGGGYAHAVSPAYGKAWTAASGPWLLFLLLVSLRLDGERGDAREVFGRMWWLAVYFPLWVLLLMLIIAHQMLPFVWDVDVFQIPPPLPLRGVEEDAGYRMWKRRVEGWLSSSRPVGKLRETATAALTAMREMVRGKRIAVVAGDSGDDGVDGDDDVGDKDGDGGEDSGGGKGSDRGKDSNDGKNGDGAGDCDGCKDGDADAA